MGRWVHPASLGSLGFALGVVGFIQCRWVHSGLLCGPLNSSGVVGFNRFCNWGRFVYPGSLDSLGFALVVICFFPGSLGSLGFVVGFTRVRAGGRWDHAGSLRSLAFSLGVVGFIWNVIMGMTLWVQAPVYTVRHTHSVAPHTHSKRLIFHYTKCWNMLAYFSGNWGSSATPCPLRGVHLGSRWWSLGSFEVVGLVHLQSLGSLGFALGVAEYALVVNGFHRRRWVHLGSPWGSLGSSGFNGVHSDSPWGSFSLSGVVGFTPDRHGGSWVHPGSLGSLGFALQVVRLICGRWVHSRSPWGSFGSSRALRFRLWGGRVYSGSFGSLGCALGVVGFILGRWCHSVSPLVSLSSYGVIGFTQVRAGCCRVHTGSLGSQGFTLGWLCSSGVVGFT